MKKLLSIWSGRLMALLVPAFLVACFLAPSNALASKEVRIGRDRTGGGEGDPLDTNDCGGGGGGGSDVNDDAGLTAIDDPLVFGYQAYRIILIPEYLDGKVVFRILVVKATDPILDSFSVEGSHAP